jgi:hypothetical protein
VDRNIQALHSVCGEWWNNPAEANGTKMERLKENQDYG